MTLDQLQAVVLRLASTGLCRYWVHWNYPVDEPWLMAVRYGETTVQLGSGPEDFLYMNEDLRSLGGDWNREARVWTFIRTNDNGTPFTIRDETPVPDHIPPRGASTTEVAPGIVSVDLDHPDAFKDLEDLLGF